MVIQSTALRKLQKLGLQSSNYALTLERLMESDILMTELAKELEITTAAATGLVDSLVRKELATRKHDTVDRRAVIVSISGKGRELLGVEPPETEGTKRIWKELKEDFESHYSKPRATRDTEQP